MLVKTEILLTHFTVTNQIPKQTLQKCLRKTMACSFVSVKAKNVNKKLINMTATGVSND